MTGYSAPAPIGYSIPGAAEAIGQSIDTIKKAIAKGDITPRYPNRKPIIGHADLLEWFNALPVDKPKTA